MTADLGGRIRAAIDAAPSDATPQEIAFTVADAMTEVEAKKYLGTLLTETVKALIRGYRKDALSQVCQPGGRAPKQGYSPKLSARRDMWEDLMAARVHVGGNAYKFMADCTMADLQFCVADRELLIKRTSEQISYYEQLIAAMRKHKVATVGLLPRGAVAA